MSQDIPVSFVRQYESEVHEAYQRMGSKLRNTVRNKNNITGKSTTFQKVGKGEARQKTRHGKVPVMNVSHEPVECPLGDWFAGDWVDSLDELKINHNERQVVANAGAYALGRKTDSLIIDLALANATYQVPANNEGMTKAKADATFAGLGKRDVPMDDGAITAVVGVDQWTDLTNIDQFSNADYVGQTDLPYKGRGMVAKWWMGMMWMFHTGLPVTAADIRSCFAYHRTAVGHASGQDVTSNIQWHNDYDSHFVNNKMSQGAVLIDTEGVQEILCDESPA